MSSVRSCVVLSSGDVRLVMPAWVGERAETGYFANSIVGWYSHPDLKVTQTERQSGNGAFDVPGRDVLYAARTVTLGVSMRARSRDAVTSLVDGLLALAGHLVSMEVQDGSAATSATGYLRAEVSDGMHDHGAAATVTVVCPDPRRRSTTPMRGYMVPAAMGALGGLAYSRAHVLAWPLDWGEVPEAANSCTLANRGTATAHPTITLSGTLAAGATVTHAAGQLAYDMPIQPGAPVVLDCLSRTASCNGVDVTRWLSRRDFPDVPAGGSLRLSLMATGAGACEAEARDTYI